MDLTLHRLIPICLWMISKEQIETHASAYLWHKLMAYASNGFYTEEGLDVIEDRSGSVFAQVSSSSD